MLELETQPDGRHIRLLYQGKALRLPPVAGEPERKILEVPSRALAEALAALVPDAKALSGFWQKPLAALTALAASEMPRHRTRHQDALIAYAPTDMLRYLSEGPEELVHLQEQRWTPVRRWVEQRLDVMIPTTTGILPLGEHEELNLRLNQWLGRMSHWHFSALHQATNMTGSLLLALAFISGRLTVNDTLEAAQLDELFQARQWQKNGEIDPVLAGKHTRICDELTVLEAYIHLLADTA